MLYPYPANRVIHHQGNERHHLRSFVSHSLMAGSHPTVRARQKGSFPNYQYSFCLAPTANPSHSINRPTIQSNLKSPISNLSPPTPCKSTALFSTHLFPPERLIQVCCDYFPSSVYASHNSRRFPANRGSFLISGVHPDGQRWYRQIP